MFVLLLWNRPRSQRSNLQSFLVPCLESQRLLQLLVHLKLGRSSSSGYAPPASSFISCSFIDRVAEDFESTLVSQKLEVQVGDHIVHLSLGFHPPLDELSHSAIVLDLNLLILNVIFSLNSNSVEICCLKDVSMSWVWSQWKLKMVKVLRRLRVRKKEVNRGQALQVLMAILGTNIKGCSPLTTGQDYRSTTSTSTTTCWPRTRPSSFAGFGSSSLAIIFLQCEQIDHEISYQAGEKAGSSVNVEWLTRKLSQKPTT